MTDELQPEGEEVLTDEPQPETAEGGAELAPATGENQQKNEDGVQKAINKQHAKYREEERKRIAAEKEAEELKERLNALEAQKDEIVIPPVPDPYDDDYDQKMSAREEAIRKQAVADAQQQSVKERQKENEEAARRAENERLQTLAEDYDKRIVKLGLDVGEVRKAGDKVLEYGISGDLVDHILKQEEGPLITKYLADNPIVLDELRHMTPIDAAMRINNDIKAAASSMKPQPTTAPDPAETLSGRGAGEKVSSLIKGATFE